MVALGTGLLPRTGGHVTLRPRVRRWARRARTPPALPLPHLAYGLMAHRMVTDPSGSTWQAWAVRPCAVPAPIPVGAPMTVAGSSRRPAP